MIPKVSIIVPVYNAGERLRHCLDSLINQTLKDIEIILVLDCPTDGSDRVAEEYAVKDSRIKLIHNNQNLNIGLSRNEGLKVAKGEYIGFSDHDDYCLQQMFETLYNRATETGVDVVISDIGEDVDGNRYTTGFPLQTETTQEHFKDEYLRALINGIPFKRGTRSFDNCNSIWNQIYKRSVLTANSVWFSDNRVLTYEDSLFLIKVYSCAAGVSYVPEALYFHVETGENEYHSYGYRSIAKVRAYLYEMIDFLESVDDETSKKYAQCISNSIFQRIFTSLLNELHFKGLCAFYNAMRHVRLDSKLIYPLKEHKPDIMFTLAKRLVLRYLLS